ncbi:MAG TPA: hypothetical protein VJQ82_13900 [Terriglobales bacterium]|nr:hypothetical protein [Terriglobales bacterium]
MSKHTPGPWTFQLSMLDTKEGPTGFSILSEGKARSVVSAGVYEHQALTVSSSFRHLDCFNAYYSPEEVEANARLIAAAPELLETCKKALGAIMAELDAQDAYKHSVLDGAVVALTNAIANAEGRE